MARYPTVAVVLFLVSWLASACAGGASATHSRTHQRDHRHRLLAVVPSASGNPLPAKQASVIGHVDGSVGGYTTLVIVTNASRSTPVGATQTLITLAGIGRLRVSCTRNPHGSFILTPFAAGEGPPTVTSTTSTTSRQTSLPSYTRGVAMTIPPREASHQLAETWHISGGGEAFQFTATITDLLTPTTTRCDLLAQATVVTHGPFYHYAHLTP